MPRAPLVALALAVSTPALLRASARHPAAPRPCAPEGRGAPPGHWVGCAGDDGPPRDLTGGERLAFGLRVDLNRATAEDLAGVPGIGERLAAEVVAERSARGRYATVDALARVRGIGPARLARARPHLVAGNGPVE